MKQIKSLGRVVTGKTPPTNNSEYFGGDDLFVSPKDLDWNSHYITETETRITSKALAKFKNQVIPRNTVMFTSLSFAFGKMGIASKPCLTNQQINSVIVNRENSSKFVYYLLRAYEPIIFSYNSGIDTPIVPKSVFEKIEVKIPFRTLQEKIAATLSAYDELIENNQRRIALLEKMAEEIYREWFVRLRFPGHEKVTKVKGVPDGWLPSCLRNVAKFTMGQSPSSEFYNEVGNGLPFHQGVGTYGERFPQTITYCSEDGRRAHKGDILFSVRAPVGRLNIADREMIIGRGLTAIRHKKDHNHWLYYLLKTAFVHEDIIGNGSIFNSVGKDELARFSIFEPEPSLVVRFDAIASKIDEQITVLIHATECLKSSRDALLPRLISGKLSVENLDIQFPPGMEECAHEV
ncbi:MAG: restriction endonuclease subunit S [Betaproteobacteria bacterium]|nr:restriction endonuclease subunit S [Betaproteobacteria bacterium]